MADQEPQVRVAYLLLINLVIVPITFFLAWTEPFLLFKIIEFTKILNNTNQLSYNHYKI